MREIATRAGVSQGSAYYYFDGKDAFVQELYLRIQAEQRERALPRLRAGAPLRENLRSTLHGGESVLGRLDAGSHRSDGVDETGVDLFTGRSVDAGPPAAAGPVVAGPSRGHAALGHRHLARAAPQPGPGRWSLAHHRPHGRAEQGAWWASAGDRRLRPDGSSVRAHLTQEHLMMTVVIAGATGFIGTHLRQAFELEGIHRGRAGAQESLVAPFAPLTRRGVLPVQLG